MAFVEFKNVYKKYNEGKSSEIVANRDVSFEIEHGEFCVIVGPSGAGKSTILNILGGMDDATSGEIFIDGKDICKFNKRQLNDYRRFDVGFVFQFYNLIPNLTVLENVELAGQIVKESLSPTGVLESVELSHRLKNFPSQLSGEGFSLGSSLYFFVFPLLIALPYGWSFCGEKNSGYMRQMLVRAGEKSYLTAKFLATFIAGGLAMVVPLIINFMLTALFIPAITPVPTYDTMYGVFGNSLFSSLYYTQPFAYVAVYMLVDFMFCGALACITMLSALFIKYKWVNCIFPFAVAMVLNVLNNMLFSNTPGAENYQFSPFYFTKCVQTGYPAKLWIIVLMSMLMAVITIVVNVVLMHKKDVM